MVGQKLQENVEKFKLSMAEGFEEKKKETVPGHMAVLNWVSVAMWYSYCPLLIPESPSVFFPMPPAFFFCPDCHSFPTRIRILTQSFLLGWQGSGSYWCKAQLFSPIAICRSTPTEDITVYYLNLVLVTHPCFSLAGLVRQGCASLL